jgi:hypothetical protein
MADDRLRGVLTSDNVAEFVMIEAARNAGARGDGQGPVDRAA